jgi:hypothetical protein
MKNAGLIVGLLLCVNSLAFSIQESWMSAGFEFGNYVEFGPDHEFTYLGSPGFDFNMYTFKDRQNIGLYWHFSGLFPVIEKSDKTPYDYLLQYDWIMGPGFRYPLGKNLTLAFGVGVEVMAPLYAKYTENSIDYSLVLFNLGLGGEVGIKYNFTDKFYLNAGLSLSHSFINRTAKYTYSDDRKVRTTISEEWTFNYAMFGVKPFINIGINMYGERGKYGRPD